MNGPRCYIGNEFDPSVHCRGLLLDALDSWTPEPNWSRRDR